MDEAIQYLFPTGLFDPKVKPVMKPPEEIFPPIITVELNADQRPADSLFFTARPKFYRILSVCPLTCLQIRSSINNGFRKSTR